MEIIFVLIAISLVLAISFLILFIRALRSGQYDDTYTPSVRILFDKSKKKKSTLTEDNTTKNE
ncbi:cbb3-type cytochrome oxidase assembly protein CcoS [Echinicola pacifica]|uniref:cbb3-type cytochrome oxidase assembly protein CcoS n=1 Tax=Echinicola pacifica TaxID=346377 RepID=UPI00035D7F9A|nr:cbb3-type cytochrome oxidase assembly protein CcoS [Echinicola pacifica]